MYDFSLTASAQRIWAMRVLHRVLVPLPAHLQKVQEAQANQQGRPAPPPPQDPLPPLMRALPELLRRQFEYEEPLVRGGVHLMHSEFFQVLIGLACGIELDKVLADNGYKWTWFRRYCSAARVANSLIHR